MHSGTQALRARARDMFDAAVRRADPARAVALHLAAAPLPALPDGRTYVVAVGKAAVPMMRAALELISDVEAALVVTNPENAAPVTGARVLTGAHPVPDASSARAGQAVIDLVARAGAKDRVIALISGGGSALMTAPAGAITLDDFARANMLLLSSGLEINEMNLIRQQIDEVKGGGLLRHAAPAEVHGLLLSDVIGDDLRAIASGPTVSAIGSAHDAVRLLQHADLWEAMPASVRAHLGAAHPVKTLPPVSNHIIGSNSASLQAMIEAAPAGFAARIVSDALTGDVAAAAGQILQAAVAATGPVALIFGGETTVQLRGDGLGGRNQELALRVALGAGAQLAPGWVFLSGGTDGRDGPTDAAGGLVDAGTGARIAQAGGDAGALLARNDSYRALGLANDLLICGGTGTNVADVQVLLKP